MINSLWFIAWLINTPNSNTFWCNTANDLCAIWWPYLESSNVWEISRLRIGWRYFGANYEDKYQLLVSDHKTVAFISVRPHANWIHLTECFVTCSPKSDYGRSLYDDIAERKVSFYFKIFFFVSVWVSCAFWELI